MIKIHLSEHVALAIKQNNDVIPPLQTDAGGFDSSSARSGWHFKLCWAATTASASIDNTASTASSVYQLEWC
jgi:hypothetical protein